MSIIIYSSFIITAGVIRRGHIREFLLPSSRETSVSVELKIVHISDSILKSRLGSAADSGTRAYISEQNVPDVFVPFIKNDMLYLHAHEHPQCVLSVIMAPEVEPGTIVLNELQLVNSKVCRADKEKWTVYQGNKYIGLIVHNGNHSM